MLALKIAKATFSGSVIVFLVALAWQMAGLGALSVAFVVSAVSFAGIALSATAWSMIWVIGKTRS
jgi:hypothetical protein